MVMLRVPRVLQPLARHIRTRDRRPLIGASYVAASRRFWSGAFSFRGRASRSEFWWQRLTDLVVVLAVLSLAPHADGAQADATLIYQDTPSYLGIGQSVFGLFFGWTDAAGHTHPFTVVHGGPPAQWILFAWFVATLVPNLALGVRRLHNRNLSGWGALFSCVPLIDLVLLVGATRGSVLEGESYDYRRPKRRRNSPQASPVPDVLV